MTKEPNIKFFLSVPAITFIAFFVFSAPGINGFLIGSAQTVEAIEKEIPAGTVAIDEIRFTAVGDTGTGGSQQLAVAQQMLAVQQRTGFDLTLFLGDNIYPSGAPGEIETKFLKPYSGLLERGVEMRGCIGNHDALNDSGILLQQLIFRMGAKTYYSFERKNKLIEFFALDSNLLLSSAPNQERDAQLAWLENSLAKSNAVWKLVFLHHPLYSSAKKHGIGSPDEKEMLHVRESVEPILRKYRVDLVLSGHDHVYERPAPQGRIQYFTSGTGGKLRRGDLIKTSPFYGVGNDEENSFMLFSITPRAAQFWSIGSTGTVLDRGEIKKTGN